MFSALPEWWNKTWDTMQFLNKINDSPFSYALCSLSRSHTAGIMSKYQRLQINFSEITTKIQGKRKIRRNMYGNF